MLAAGRGSQIFEFGTDRVLRRSLHDVSLAREANVMELARGFGVPVPAVHELRANDREMVMDRIPGPTMVDWILRRPWQLQRAAAILAELHDAVHRIPAPSWLRDAGDGGDVLVHLDLHPLNVIMGPRGPVLIDWTNSARGLAETDVALTWVLLRTGEAPANAVMARLVDRFRGGLIRAFLTHFETATIHDALPYAAELRLCDSTLTDTERVAITKLLQSP